VADKHVYENINSRQLATLKQTSNEYVTQTTDVQKSLVHNSNDLKTHTFRNSKHSSEKHGVRTQPTKEEMDGGANITDLKDSTKHLSNINKTPNITDIADLEEDLHKVTGGQLLTDNMKSRSQVKITSQVEASGDVVEILPQPDVKHFDTYRNKAVNMSEMVWGNSAAKGTLRDGSSTKLMNVN
jgi:hypothetical protein